MLEPTKNFLLDFIPLTMEVHEQNAVYAAEMQRAALRLLDFPTAWTVQQLRGYVDLAEGLGYVDADVHRYIVKMLERLEREINGQRPGDA